jgi:MinD superfamily P-loop ATPase
VCVPTHEALPQSLPMVGRRIPELVVISGKGGTGKTSLVASFSVLARNLVLADCDVDAADLYLVLEPHDTETHGFKSGHEAIVRADRCLLCGTCEDVCRFGAVTFEPGVPDAAIDPLACEGCGVCVEFCPSKAIDFEERRCGEWFVSTTRSGPMVHARLDIAAENSGKLVSTVRSEARELAARKGAAAILIDGPPGIGCPVIAAITGATGVLVVTEPTISGDHDMDRVLALANHFGIPTAVCINRWDINPEGAARIEIRARDRGAVLAGLVRYDPAVTTAQVEGRAVVEIGGDAADDIRTVWDNVQHWLGGVVGGKSGRWKELKE